MDRRRCVAAIVGNLNKEHGGAQQLLYDVFSRLPDDLEPVVYYMFGPGTFRDDFERAGVRVRPLEARSNLDPRAFLRLVAALRRDRPDVLETNSPISGIWGRIAGTMAGVPCVVSVEHNRHDAYRVAPRLANGLTLPLADAVVGVSEAVTGSLFAWERTLLPGETELVTIPNGIDVEQFSPSARGEVPGEGPTVGTVGQISRQKGYEHLVRAWPRVSEAVPEARLRIVGDGPLREPLEELAANLGVTGSVTFTGYVADPVPEYRRFDVAAFPSLWEGLPLTLLQAMATAVPVVTSDIRPNRTVIGDGGVTIPVGDEDALARALVDLLEDPDRRSKMGASGRERVRRLYSTRRVVEDYVELFRRCPGDDR